MMRKIWETTKKMAGELVWYALGVVIALLSLVLLVLTAYIFHLLFTMPWIFDGSNPRFG